MKKKPLQKRIEAAIDSCLTCDGVDTPAAAMKIMKIVRAELKAERDFWRCQP